MGEGRTMQEQLSRATQGAVAEGSETSFDVPVPVECKAVSFTSSDCLCFIRQYIEHTDINEIIGLTEAENEAN